MATFARGGADEAAGVVTHVAPVRRRTVLHAGQLLFTGVLRQERASKRTGILQSWMRLQAARAKIRRFLWRYWTLRVVTLDTIHEITEGRACPDHPFSHPLGFEVLAPLSLRDRWIFLRANRLAFHVPAARTSSRHVLDWLRKPFCGGPHWLHQDRIQFWLDADGVPCWEVPDSEGGK